MSGVGSPVSVKWVACVCDPQCPQNNTTWGITVLNSLVPREVQLIMLSHENLTAWWQWPNPGQSGCYRAHTHSHGLSSFCLQFLSSFEAGEKSLEE